MIPSSSEEKQHVSGFVTGGKSFCPEWHRASYLSLDKELEILREELYLRLMVPIYWMCVACLSRQPQKKCGHPLLTPKKGSLIAEAGVLT